jgi:hypothetical protein
VNKNNCYASKFRNTKHNIFSKMSKVNDWQPATAQAIHRVLAFFMFMGAIWKASLRAYST